MIAEWLLGTRRDKMKYMVVLCHVCTVLGTYVCDITNRLVSA